MFYRQNYIKYSKINLKTDLPLVANKRKASSICTLLSAFLLFLGCTEIAGTNVTGDLTNFVTNLYNNSAETVDSALNGPLPPAPVTLEIPSVRDSAIAIADSILTTPHSLTSIVLPLVGSLIGALLIVKPLYSGYCGWKKGLKEGRLQGIVDKLHQSPKITNSESALDRRRHYDTLSPMTRHSHWCQSVSRPSAQKRDKVVSFKKS